MKRLFIGLAAILCLTLSGCTLEQEPVEASFFAMNTYMTFTVYGKNAQTALEDATERIRSLGLLWSVTDENSEIYAANHSYGNPVKVSDETAALLSFALDMA